MIAKKGVKIYNDAASTTPEATLVALSALDPARTILIMGGTDRGLEMDGLLARLIEIKRVVLLAGTGTDRLLEFTQNAPVFDNLEKAVNEAFAAAEPGDTILFSPAFAYDMGDQFNAIVQEV